MEAVNVVTAGLVEDQPSPMHTKEFQTLSEFQSVNLDHETGNLLKGSVNFLVFVPACMPDGRQRTKAAVYFFGCV